MEEMKQAVDAKDELTSANILSQARKIAADHWRNHPSATAAHLTYACQIEAGERDTCEAVSVAIAALSTQAICPTGAGEGIK